VTPLEFKHRIYPLLDRLEKTLTPVEELNTEKQIIALVLASRFGIDKIRE